MNCSTLPILQTPCAANVAAGKWGSAFQFDNASQTLLERINNPGDALHARNIVAAAAAAWALGVTPELMRAGINAYAAEHAGRTYSSIPGKAAQRPGLS